MFIEKLNNIDVEHLVTLMEKQLSPTKTVEDLVVLSCTQTYGHLKAEIVIKFIEENVLNYDNFKLTDFKCYYNDEFNQSATETLRSYLTTKFNEYENVLNYYIDQDLNV